MIIDQLPSITLPVEDTDEMPIERGQYTYKINLADLLGSASANITVIAAEYDDSASYAVGDYCTHEGLFYRCITPVTAEAWDATKWEEVTVGEELNMVYVGASAPTSDAVKIWLDTDEPGMSAVSSVNGKTGTVVIDDIPLPLLWTNASPTSSFSAQTVAIDLTDYYFVLVEFYSDTGNARGVTVILARNGSAQRVGFSGTNQNRLVFFKRDATVSTAGIVFSGGSADYSTIDPVTSDTIIIPYKIYGLKVVTA